MVLLTTQAMNRLRDTLISFAKARVVSSKREEQAEDEVEITELTQSVDAAREFMSKNKIPQAKEEFVVGFFSYLDTIPPLNNLSEQDTKLFDALIKVRAN